MLAKRGHNLQISLGKTRSAPTCLHGLMTSPRDLMKDVIGLQSKIVSKLCEKLL